MLGAEIEANGSLLAGGLLTEVAAFIGAAGAIGFGVGAEKAAGIELAAAALDPAANGSAEAIALLGGSLKKSKSSPPAGYLLSSAPVATPVPNGFFPAAPAL